MSQDEQNRLAEVLKLRVGDNHDLAIAAMVASATKQELDAGDILFNEGDVSDALFVVVRGRLRITRLSPSEPDGFDLLGEVGRGSVVGELGIIDDAPRAASVSAIRPALVFRVSRTDFDRLSDAHPRFALALFRSLLSTTVRGTPIHNPSVTIAVACLGVNRAHVVDNIAAELARHDVVHVVDADAMGAYDEAREAGHVLLDLGADPKQVIEKAIDQADRLVLVVPEPPNSDQLQLIDAAAKRSALVPGRTVWVALEHQAHATKPVGASNLLAIAGIDEAHHLRAGNSGDLERLARLLAGVGVGLALGGGGARAFAHLGVLKAFSELGIPIDRIGGTSQGSVISAGHAMGYSPDQILAFNRPLQEQSIIDYTVPLVSLAKGQRIVEMLSPLDGYECEDLWTPWFAMTTNLTQARAEAIRTGNLKRAVRASVSLPGLFPPVPINGDLHVDGGLLDNVPGDILAADPSIGRVVAIDVTPPGGPRAKDDYGMSMTGTKAAVARMKRSGPIPGPASILVSSILVGSDRSRRKMVDDNMVDLYLSLNLKGVALLDFADLAAIADRGYQDSIEPLRSWWGTMT